MSSQAAVLRMEADDTRVRAVFLQAAGIREARLLRHGWDALATSSNSANGTSKGFWSKRFPRLGVKKSKKNALGPGLDLINDNVPSADDLNPFSEDTEDQQQTQAAGNEQTESQPKKGVNIFRRGPKTNKPKAPKISKTQKKAERRTSKALERAEAERRRWEEQVEQEEQELAAACRERREVWVAKATRRSEHLLLQHLCAIAVQSMWRSRAARNELARRANSDTDPAAEAPLMQEQQQEEERVRTKGEQQEHQEKEQEEEQQEKAQEQREWRPETPQSREELPSIPALPPTPEGARKPPNVIAPSLVALAEGQRVLSP